MQSSPWPFLNLYTLFPETPVRIDQNLLLRRIIDTSISVALSSFKSVEALGPFGFNDVAGFTIGEAHFHLLVVEIIILCGECIVKVSDVA